MGSGIAQVAAAAGNTVKLIDTQEGALTRALTVIESSLARLVKKAAVTQAAADDTSKRIRNGPVVGIEDVDDVAEDVRG